jgi:hypothetical protein
VGLLFCHFAIFVYSLLFVKITDNAERRAQMQKIWNEFLEPGAPYEVCVDFGNRGVVQQLIQDKATDLPADILDPMMIELENIMTHNLYVQFCKRVRETNQLDFAVRKQQVPIISKKPKFCGFLLP